MDITFPKQFPPSNQNKQLILWSINIIPPGKDMQSLSTMNFSSIDILVLPNKQNTFIENRQAGRQGVVVLSCADKC